MFIEEIMESRGERAPPRPKMAIAPQSHDPIKGSQKALNFFLVACFLLVSAFVSQFLSQVSKRNLLIGWVICLLIAVFFFFRWLRERSLSPDARAREQAFKRIGENGFTELMFYAGEGNLDRVRDLLNYSAVIDAQDERGGTALMYASKNGHLEVAQFLLKSGADRRLKTTKGISAASFAKRNGHLEIAGLLE